MRSGRLADDGGCLAEMGKRPGGRSLVGSLDTAS